MGEKTKYEQIIDLENLEQIDGYFMYGNAHMRLDPATSAEEYNTIEDLLVSLNELKNMASLQKETGIEIEGGVYTAEGHFKTEYHGQAVAPYLGYDNGKTEKNLDAEINAMERRPALEEGKYYLVSGPPTSVKDPIIPALQNTIDSLSKLKDLDIVDSAKLQTAAMVVDTNLRNHTQALWAIDGLTQSPAEKQMRADWAEGKQSEHQPAISRLLETMNDNRYKEALTEAAQDAALEKPKPNLSEEAEVAKSATNAISR